MRDNRRACYIRRMRRTGRLYAVEDIFRSRVVMGRHGFGRGEYKYFSYPLPDIISGLRTSIYPQLVPVANRWNEAMGIDVRYPAKHRRFHQAMPCCGPAPSDAFTVAICTRRL